MQRDATVDDVIIKDVPALRNHLNGVADKVAEFEDWNNKADAALAELNKNIAHLMDAKELAQASTARSAEIVDNTLQDMKTSIAGAGENLGREIVEIREVFNSLVSHLNLRYRVAICRNC